MSLIFAESETTSLTLVDFDDTTPGDYPVIGTVGEAIEASKTRARSGKYLSSLSELVTLLAELGANGPSHLQNVNISDIGIQVGHGNQFDVFRQVDHGPGHSLQNVVYKRVKLRPKRTDSDYAVDHDYPDRKTPIPVLVMEAARFPLSEMLKDLQHHLDTLIAVSHWDVRHHIALDVAAGVEALHSSEIIHGDIKPANVLVFRQDNPSVPFLAKLSDFGVCIDMSDHKISARDYYGTPKWVGPEAIDHDLAYDDTLFGPFHAHHLKQFDSFSYGMLLLALFVTPGGVAPKLGLDRENLKEENIRSCTRLLLRDAGSLPADISHTLDKALHSLLRMRPCDRALPTIALLTTNRPSYLAWLHESTTKDENIEAGKTSPSYNTGPVYWARLDERVFEDLNRQFDQNKKVRQLPDFLGATLLGLALKASTSSLEENRQKVLDYLLAASLKGHTPAQAICSRVHASQSKELAVSKATLRIWAANSVRQGYVFHQPEELSPKEILSFRDDFRSAGGYSSARAIGAKSILSIPQEAYEDSYDNSILHAYAAIGACTSLDDVLQQNKWIQLPKNKKDETPIDSACQGGHVNCLKLLVSLNLRASSMSTTSPSPLHWLFAFPDDDIAEALRLLLQAGADINHRYLGVEDAKFPTCASAHFPFTWPLGTPLHWAVFARSHVAVKCLIESGADVNMPLADWHPAGSPLQQAAYRGDTQTVKLLLRLKADPSLKHTKAQNFLHLLSSVPEGTLFPSPELQRWVRCGSWEESLEALTIVVQDLVAAGVDLELKSTAWDQPTPLLQAVANGNDVVALALLKNGANVEGNPDRETPLHAWASVNAQSTCYPGSHSKIFRFLVEKAIDVHTLVGWQKETAMHRLTRLKDTDQFLKDVNILVSNARRPANLNIQDNKGLTPIMTVVSFSESYKEISPRMRALLDHGADPSIITDSGNSIISEITSNNRLMDEDSRNLILLTVQAIESRGGDIVKFFSEICATCLAVAAADGRYETTKCLLELGMSERVNEPCKNASFGGNAMRHAFFGANNARMSYLKVMARYMKADEASAEADDSIYIHNAYGRNRAGQPSAQRRKEAYWAYPSILKLLQEHGADRGTIRRDDIETEPSFMNNFDVLASAIAPEDIRHPDHWQPLYELEQLPPDWEKDCLAKVLDYYSDAQLFTPTLQIVLRWPEVLKVMKPVEGDCVREATLAGGQLV
ncbi:hypothetical protein D6D12_00776 [Aureobasidium pullulans]|uniref:Ankyrin n=1 Tax=Aureobasidium pullulans TaxID=5580 RepID=A0AB74K606_AURPU|nr:hypothetical protein D6D12_00776 [Aureobasidium pullulans]